MERCDISLHNVGTITGLRMNGSSINKKKNKNKKNRQMYKQKIQVNQNKHLVLLPVQRAAIEIGLSDGRIYR